MVKLLHLAVRLRRLTHELLLPQLVLRILKDLHAVGEVVVEAPLGVLRDLEE